MCTVIGRESLCQQAIKVDLISDKTSNISDRQVSANKKEPYCTVSYVGMKCKLQKKQAIKLYQ